MVWCDRNCHHAIICEVEESKEVDKEEPEEFCSCPLKVNHCIYDESIVNRLDEDVWYFDYHLH